MVDIPHTAASALSELYLKGVTDGAEDVHSSVLLVNGRDQVPRCFWCACFLHHVIHCLCVPSARARARVCVCVCVCVCVSSDCNDSSYTI
jgi:hypothetical protein